MELMRSDITIPCLMEPRLENFKPRSDSLIQSLLFIRNLAIKLRLSQSCVATAQTYFHTFTINNSHLKYDNLLIAGACLFLSSKVLEQTRHIDILCRKFYDERSEIRMTLNPRLQVPPLSDSMLAGLKQNILQCEFAVLEALCFNVEISLPYSFISSFVSNLELNVYQKQDLLKIASNFANDSFRVPIFLQKSAENVAAACLFLASRYLSLGLEIAADQETVEAILEIYKSNINI
mmetsp:Transcript_22458/g.22169  ORF Transcript_22458/g.22169 Transcript_22458/m.22169 type:complete len:235 (+) Transcript_22458:28-732(+)